MKILTKEILDAFKRQGDTSKMTDDKIKVICKIFYPNGAGTWYLYEWLADDVFMCLAELGDPDAAEIGTVSLSPLIQLGVERDMYFPVGKKTLQEVKKAVKEGKVL